MSGLAGELEGGAVAPKYFVLEIAHCSLFLLLLHRIGASMGSALGQREAPLGGNERSFHAGLTGDVVL